MISNFHINMIIWFVGVSFSVLLMIFLPLWRMDNNRQSRIIIILTCVLIILGATALYIKIGAWNLSDKIESISVERSLEEEKLTQAQANADQNPKDINARTAYALALGKAGRHAEAAEEFRKAVLYSGGRPDLILNYATAQIFAAGGTVTEDALKSIEMVLLVTPQEPKARYFKAMYLQQNGKNKDAEALFLSLKSSLKPNDSLIPLIDERLHNTKKQP